MKIFNTLTRSKQEFVPINEGKVGIYVCGPTVYDYIHIGNARPMIVFDTLRRYLLYKGYDVNYVSNFTDVDDKIIKRANELGVESAVVSEKYIAECKKDMEGLNVMPATTHPQATKEIPDMIEMIKVLIEKGHAYEKNGTVYFRTRSFDGYGKLSHKNIDDLESGHRAENHQLKVSGEDEKEDPLDFVLWKPKKEGEPSWPSPWGDGRPGWHLECSVMSKKYIGDVIDIHAGGEDLIFPHHENEIAQSEAANDTEFARYWMHNGFLKINNEKMSKSLGNFFTVREISEKYPLQVIRFFMLSAHYRSPLNFSADLVEASKNGLERILTAVEKLKELKPANEGNDPAIEAELENFVKRYEAAMDDDLNTADAISVIFELIKYTNINVTNDTPKATVDKALSTVEKLCDVLGIITEKEEELLDSDIEALINERQAARKAKDFAKADEIRNKLADMGITLLDTREGVKWKRA
ncbi:cysteine--tRNA ligase [Coprococcus sp. CAG:782]|jgi:cysteinyl-tRNA synthetase|uniref:cysteine--tRNA ligase n=1 Tax=Coprococcus sp. OM04-5BH TaxID=2293093 RepID=UPI000335BF97|nr:cysteine--tRNA ligase [Coprococcus sp. OM04-5BH]MEE0035240.1 cysteine--tRNA ligase [Coprococcus sp.]RHV30302.1 cysteine--tRNA ligase [Coprococcus sp. OM04-5BH]CCY53578.1 cysteine--tRNA ligase [Coprococcus sp. CAG:782]